jgi:hypothetical protein
MIWPKKLRPKTLAASFETRPQFKQKFCHLIDQRVLKFLFIMFLETPGGLHHIHNGLNKRKKAIIMPAFMIDSMVIFLKSNILGARKSCKAAPRIPC